MLSKTFILLSSLFVLASLVSAAPFSRREFRYQNDFYVRDLELWTELEALSRRDPEVADLLRRSDANCIAEKVKAGFPAHINCAKDSHGAQKTVQLGDAFDGELEARDDGLDTLWARGSDFGHLNSHTSEHYDTAEREASHVRRHEDFDELTAREFELWNDIDARDDEFDGLWAREPASAGQKIKNSFQKLGQGIKQSAQKVGQSVKTATFKAGKAIRPRDMPQPMQAWDGSKMWNALMLTR